MLYFDQVDNKRFGTVRQQFWALCHFPFHLSLVLLMEGTSRFITWRNAIEVVNTVVAKCAQIYASSTDTRVLARRFDDYSSSLLTNVTADPVKYNVTGYIQDLANSKNASSDAASLAVVELVGTLINATLKFFKIQATKKFVKGIKQKKIKDPFAELEGVIKVYDLVFVYFFVAAGLTLVMMAILIALAKKGKCAGDYAAIGLRLIIGIGLSAIALVKVNPTLQENFLYSPWMLPSVLIGLFVVVLLDGIFGWVLPAPKMVSRSSTHESQHGMVVPYPGHT